MSGTTPILGLTIPDINDWIPAWPGIAAQGFTDLENSMIIELHAAADPHDSYPIGFSVFGVTTAGAADNGWPSGSGMVITVRRKLADLSFQWKVSQGVARGPNIYARTGASSYGWSPWSRAASPDLPWAVASGTVLVSDVAEGATKTTTVAFPSGTFTAAPTVTVAAQTNGPRAFSLSVGAVSASSFPLNVGRMITGSGSVVVHWQAIQGTD